MRSGVRKVGGAFTVALSYTPNVYNAAEDLWIPHVFSNNRLCPWSLDMDVMRCEGIASLVKRHSVPLRSAVRFDSCISLEGRYIESLRIFWCREVTKLVHVLLLKIRVSTETRQDECSYSSGPLWDCKRLQTPFSDRVFLCRIFFGDKGL